MKKCYTCKQTKDTTEFNKNKSRKDGLNTICKTCSRERSRRYYEENKEHHKKNIYKLKKQRIEKARDFVYGFLATNSCIDCGETDPIVLEFDHQRDKKKAISSMVGEGYATDTIQEEIEKCEVRCANCHRRKTAKDFGWYTFKQ